MKNAEIISNTINNLLPNVKRGTLRFYGQWFGRPLDNVHTIVKSDFQQNTLMIYFDEDEILTIVEPGSYHINQDNFVIKSARRVRWEWYYYGYEKTSENLKVLDYVSSNYGFSVKGPKGNFFNLKFPAMEIV